MYVGNKGIQDIRIGSGGGAGVIRIKPEYEHLYRFEPSTESRSIGDLIVIPKSGRTYIPSDHIEFCTLRY